MNHRVNRVPRARARACGRGAGVTTGPIAPDLVGATRDGIARRGVRPRFRHERRADVRLRGDVRAPASDLEGGFTLPSEPSPVEVVLGAESNAAGDGDERATDGRFAGDCRRRHRGRVDADSETPDAVHDEEETVAPGECVGNVLGDDFSPSPRGSSRRAFGTGRGGGRRVGGGPLGSPCPCGPSPRWPGAGRGPCPGARPRGAGGASPRGGGERHLDRQAGGGVAVVEAHVRDRLVRHRGGADYPNDRSEGGERSCEAQRRRSREGRGASGDAKRRTNRSRHTPAPRR